MALALLLIFLLVNSGVFGQNWNVIYKSTSMCVLKGSSVNMSCTYRYPRWHTLTDTVWVNIPNTKSLKEYPEYKDRVEYIDDRLNKTAVLRLNNVTKNDEKEYGFRMITDINKWSGKPGIQLHVSGLQVQAPPLVLEKETLNLTCRSSCNLTDRFIWYKNGQALNFTSDTLQFQAVRSDSGRYSCAVRGHEHLPSPAVSISVEYPPQSVSVSISPSGVIVEGDSVTLNCSSDSNPPALNFSWFKQGKFLQSGDTFSLINIKSEASGNYRCSARNKHGSRTSAVVTVNVMYAPRNVSVSISPSGVIVEGDSVTLNCSSDSNPPAEINWIKGGTIVGSAILNISNISSDDSGEYKCRSRNTHGEKDSDAVMLNVMYTPRNVSVLINGSGVIVEGDSVTLKCSSDSNPPALNFSWFKEKETSAVGSGQTFSISSFNSSFSGRFYCEAQNKYGSRRSASVSLTVNGVQKSGWNNMHIIAVFAAIAVAVGFGLLFHMVGFNIGFKRNKKRSNDPKVPEQPSTEKTSESGDGKNASIQDGRNTDTKKPEEDEIHYASITFHHRATEAKSTASQEKDLSVIYSSIR